MTEPTIFDESLLNTLHPPERGKVGWLLAALRSQARELTVAQARGVFHENLAARAESIVQFLSRRAARLGRWRARPPNRMAG